jgi:hypothetical protein
MAASKEAGGETKQKGIVDSGDSIGLERTLKTKSAEQTRNMLAKYFVLR